MSSFFHINTSENGPWSWPSHKHEMCEISYFIKGSVHFILENGELTASAHQLIFLPPNSLHAESSDQPVASYYILTSFCPPNIPPLVAIDDLPDLPILHLFQQMYTEYKRKPLRNIEIFQKYIELIDLYCKQFGRHEGNALIREMCMILNHNISNPSFKIKEGFKHLRFSLDYLRTIFHNHMGMTPREYLIKQRLDYACRLLSQTDYNRISIKAISAQCGFSDPLYFSRLFKSKHGLSPSNYIIISSNDDNKKCFNPIIMSQQMKKSSKNSYLSPNPDERYSPE